MCTSFDSQRRGSTQTFEMVVMGFVAVGPAFEDRRSFLAGSRGFAAGNDHRDWTSLRDS
jgi:hypothetical protein